MRPIKLLCQSLVLIGLCLMAAVNAIAESVIIKNARIVGVEGIAEQTSDILIDGAVIKRIATSLKPNNTRTIDAKGMPVSAGLFNADSQIGVREVSAVSSTVDSSTNDESITASLAIADAFNPSSVVIPYNRTLGVTHTLIQPSNGSGLFAGVASVVNLSGSGESIEVEKAAMVVSLGETGSDLAGGSRAAAMAVLREAIEDARDYANNKSNFNSGNHRQYSLSRHDLDALVPVVNRRLPLLVKVERAADIERVLTFAKQQRLSLILSGVSEGWRVADKIAAADVPVIFDPINNLPSSYETLGTRLDNASILHQAGVTLMFTGMGFQNTHNAYLVRQSAGNAVANGLPYGAAIQAMTTNPARIFGLPNHGEVKEGHVATLVVWSGDPLEVTSNPRHVFIQGKEFGLQSRATRLRDRYYQKLKPN